MNIKKNDTVKVIAGKDKGTQGSVVKVFPKDNLVVVSGVGVAKRHEKPSKANQSGGIVSKEMPISASNVMVVDAKTGKPTRVRRVREAGKPSKRVAVKGGNQLD